MKNRRFGEDSGLRARAAEMIVRIVDACDRHWRGRAQPIYAGRERTPFDRECILEARAARAEDPPPRGAFERLPDGNLRFRRKEF